MSWPSFSREANKQLTSILAGPHRESRIPLRYSRARKEKPCVVSACVGPLEGGRTYSRGLPRAAYGNLLGKLPCLIGWHDDVDAAVGHRLTHLVLHAGPLDQELRENYAGGLFVLEREAPGTEVCGRLVGVEHHQDGQVPRAIEPQVGGDDFQILSGDGIGGDVVAFAHDAGLGAILLQGYVIGGEGGRWPPLRGVF